MIVRTAMEVNIGNRKEYVDSKAYTIIRHEGYLQGKAEAIDECAEVVSSIHDFCRICPIDCDYVTSCKEQWVMFLREVLKGDK